MAGIRADNPKGTGWEYSLDQVNWQPSRVFMSQPGGEPFVPGTTYTVYCRNQSQNLVAIKSILFGQPSSSSPQPNSLDIALQGGANSLIVPLFEGGFAAILPAEPPGANYPVMSVGPDGTAYFKGVEVPNAPTPLTVVSVGELYSLVANEVIVLSHFILRLDHNDCTEMRGWIVDTNNLGTSQQVRIECDGSIVATVTASISRPDVRDNFLIPNGYPTQATVFGWSFQKPANQFRDGLPHTWAVYGGSTGIAAISEVGAPFTTTCGTVANAIPTVGNPMPDKNITTPGAGYFDLPTDEFSNDDGVVSRRAYKYDGGNNSSYPLPNGLTFDIATGRFNYTADFPNGGFPVRVVGADLANQSVDDIFLLTFNRVAATPQINMVAYAFQKNNPSAGNPSNLDVYVATNSPLEISYSYNSGSGSTQSNYTPITQQGSWNGYNYHISIVGLYSGLVVTLRFRVAGSSSDLLVITLPALPNGNFPFSQIYPNSN